MNIESKPPTIKGSADRFAGDVYVDPLAAPKDGDQGVALIGTRDGKVIRATLGRTIEHVTDEDYTNATEA